MTHFLTRPYLFNKTTTGSNLIEHFITKKNNTLHSSRLSNVLSARAADNNNNNLIVVRHYQRDTNTLRERIVNKQRQFCTVIDKMNSKMDG